MACGGLVKPDGIREEPDELSEKDEDRPPEDEKMENPRIEFLPDPGVGENDCQQGLDPSAHLIETVLFLSQAPETIMAPPDAQDEQAGKPDQKDQRANDDRQKDLHDVNFLA